MSLAFKQFKLYLRVAVVLVVVGLVALVLFKNRNHTVQFWFFGLLDENKPINVIWLLWWTAGVTLVVARVVWFTRGMIGEFRKVRTMKAERHAAGEHARRLRELEERERRVRETASARQGRGNEKGDGETNDNSAQGGAT